MRLRSLFVCALFCSLGIHTAWSQEDFWHQTGGPLANQDVRSLASNSQGHVFAGTWTYGEVYKTTNNGDSWTVCGALPDPNPVLGLVVDSQDHIFASVWLKGIARSTDNGVTWQMKNNGLTSFTVRRSVVDRQGNIWVGTEGGLFMSTNHGESWTLARSGAYGGAFVDSTGAIVTGDAYTLVRSTDGGATWSTKPMTTCVIGAIHADGSYFGWNEPSQLFRSTDYGTTWTNLQPPVTWGGGTVILMCPPLGDYFYARDGGGILRSTDKGLSWQVKNDGMTRPGAATLCYTLHGYVFAGTGGAGVFRSTQPLTPQDVSVSLPDVVTATGSTLEIPVNVTGLSGHGICAYEFTLSFNSPDSILNFDATPITSGTLSSQANWSVLVNTSVPNQVTVGAYGATPLSGQGALVKLKLTATGTAEAGDSSHLSFSRFLFNAGSPVPSLDGGLVTIHERVCGDADENGQVQAYDGALTLREALMPMSPPPPPLTALGRLNADITLNGKVEAYDAALILRHVVGLSMPESTATCFGTGEGSTTPAESLDLAGTVLGVEHGGDHTVVVIRLSNTPAAMEVYSFAFELTASAASDDTTSLILPSLPQGSLATVNRLGNGHFKVGIVNPYGIDVEGVMLTLSARHGLSLNTITFSELFLNDAPNAEITLANIITDIKPPADERAHPVSFDLIGAYPNPFNPSTRIVFQTPATGQAHLEIYSAQGARVKALHFPQPGSGWHEVIWDGTNDLGQGVATGQYFCVMRAGSFIKAIRLMLLK